MCNTVVLSDQPPTNKLSAFIILDKKTCWDRTSVTSDVWESELMAINVSLNLQTSNSVQVISPPLCSVFFFFLILKISAISRRTAARFTCFVFRLRWLFVTCFVKQVKTLAQDSSHHVSVTVTSSGLPDWGTTRKCVRAHRSSSEGQHDGRLHCPHQAIRLQLWHQGTLLTGYWRKPFLYISHQSRCRWRLQKTSFT